MKNILNFRQIIRLVLITVGLFNFAHGQTPTEPQLLDPNQTIEREMKGAETHQYKFDLKKDEFFQVRVEQKGVDVSLKLLDEKGNVLATMDSPNGKEGFETLTWVPNYSRSYLLEVSNLDAKLEKGNYSIKRQESRISDEQDKTRVEIEKVFVEAIILSAKGKFEESVPFLEKSLNGWQELKDDYFFDLTKKRLDFVKTVLPDMQFFSKIDGIHQFEKETRLIYQKGTLESLVEMRKRYFEMIGQYDQFITELKTREFSKSVQNTTLKADNFLDAKWGRINTFSGISNTYNITAEVNERLKYLNLAIKEVDDVLSDKEIQSSRYFAQVSKQITYQKAIFLSSKATHLNLNNLESKIALNSANQAFALFQQTKGEKILDENEVNFQIAQILKTLGSIYQKDDDYPNSIKKFEESLTIIQTIPNVKFFESFVLKSLALAYFQSFNYKKTLEVFEKALKIAQESNDKYSEAEILGQISIIYFDLGDEAKVKENAKLQIPILLSDEYVNSIKRNLNSTLQNIPIRKPETNDSKNENDYALGNFGIYEILRQMALGRSYLVLDEFENSLKYYNQALILAQSEKDVSLESSILSSIGDIYIKQNNPKQAISYLKKNAEIEKTLTQKSYYALALRDVGFAYLEARMPNDAISYLKQSLIVWQTIKTDQKETIYRHYTTTLAHTARAYQEVGNIKLAILFGKLTVNATQIEREQLKGLDKNLQKSYIAKNEKPYRRLANILITQGRIAEAEQVLGMLKEEEYLSYLRRDDTVAKDLKGRISLSPDEKQAFEDYEKYSAVITKTAEDFGKLEKKKNALQLGESLNAEEQKQYDSLKSRYDAAVTVFNKYLDDLKVKFAANGDKSKQVAVVESDTIGLLKKLNQLHTVIISTIVGEDHLNLIVTTSDIQKAHTVEIKAADLNRLVAEFREAVKNPKVDPRPLGKQLYDKLFPAALQKDLENIKADTIVWSLDGTLRYVPMAALWDGKQYLTERYNNAVLTLASRDKLGNSASSDRQKWLAFGVGVSKPFETFYALPAVPQELCSVVNDAKKKEFCQTFGNKSGVLNGLMLTDDDFTLIGFQNNLGKTAVVHIASHFSLNAGNEIDSYLLLGGGTNRRFTLDNLRKTRLDNVELLTLSACNTAMTSGANSSGVEVEGFGALAQNQGAKTVLATLWAVADDSTRDLMTEFYRTLETEMNSGKAESLRKAQLALLQGKYKKGETPFWKRGAEIVGGNSTKQPEFKTDANAPFAHPYYWSPFVLIGNWQ